MNRNQSSRFSRIPTDVTMGRSRMPFGSSRGWDHKFTGNAGDLIPFLVQEILPGDTLSIDTGVCCRMSTPIFPVMDEAFYETFYFFVPSRLLWDHFEEFYGENKESYWTQPTEYQIPQLEIPNVESPTEEYPTKRTLKLFAVGSVGDYMGLPATNNSEHQPDYLPGVTPSPFLVNSINTYNALPFRAYVKIWNDWFRSEVVQSPAYFYTGDSTITGRLIDPDDDGTLNALYGGNCLKIGKYFDYFTSATPQPQKGDPTMIPLSGTPDGLLPVVAENQEHNLSPVSGSRAPLKFSYGGSVLPTSNIYFLGSTGGSRIASNVLDTIPSTSGEAVNMRTAYPVNLFARGSSLDTTPLGIYVNDVRMAFAVQRVLERWARYGSRMIESIEAFFGVRSPDARLQRSEYLGGSRRRIDMQQVLQTSSTDSTSPLGTTSAYSLTLNVHHDFSKSFVEPGYIIGLIAVRTLHSYQFATEKMWRKKRFFDFYLPQLANIGDQPIYSSELFDQGYKMEPISSDIPDDPVFGFNEAWADYRYKPNRISGYMRSGINGSLDVWHYSDNPYTEFGDQSYNLPYINANFIKETPANIDRTLAVPSETAHQFLFDVKLAGSITRVMPLYSIPGMVDHF